LLRFAAKYKERRASAAAPEHGRANRTREKVQDTGGSSESTNYCGYFCGLRWAIPSAWRRIERGKRAREERGIRALKAWAQSGRLGLGGSGASGDRAEVVAGEAEPGVEDD
jgi:hypothetical protein